jgi:hypothetical protein
MNTHRPARKWIYRTSSTPSWRGALLRGMRTANALKTNKGRHCEEGDSPTWQSMEFKKWIAAALTGPRNDDKRGRHFSKVYPLSGVELLTMTRSGGLLIAVLCLLPLCGFLTGCGRKLPPQPPEDAVITYPRPYPNPKLEEWAIAECPPILELCSPEELCEEYPPAVEECSSAEMCGE